MSEWQTIESAPKDGTHVVLYDKHIAKIQDSPAIVGKYNDNDEAPGWWGFGGRVFITPTKWMPLPPPPKK